MAFSRFVLQSPFCKAAGKLSYSSSSNSNLPVDVFAACCLERFPVIQPPLTEIEIRAKEMFRRMEIRNSLLSEHELRHRNDQALLKKKAKAAAADPTGLTEVEAGPFITAVEAEDMWEAEKNSFKFGSRTTEADKTNDTSTTRRCLDKKLIFLVDQHIGNDLKPLLPQIKWQANESLRDTAERALAAVLPMADPSKQQQQSPFPPLVQFLSNSPVGVYSYRYSKHVRESLNKTGAKIFFFKAHLLDWQMPLKVSSASEHENYGKAQWLTKEELKLTLPKDYARAVMPFILDF